MKPVWPLVLLSLVGVSGLGAQVTNPFEREAVPASDNPVDRQVLSLLEARGIEPARPCSDAVFLRRVYLDVTGTLPDAGAVERFLGDAAPDKRSALIDELLDGEAFAEYWALKWCDLLRVKAEFPINLWPNAVQAYHHWIRQAISRNIPLDRFAQELLTSSGSNFRVPPVNFYRAVQERTPRAIAAAVAMTFMGVRLNGWPEERASEMAVFFSRIAYKKTAEWKEEIVGLDPAPFETVDAVLPDLTRVEIPAGADPRQIFADWLITAENPWFKRNLANRVWAWLMGRGIIQEPDDIGEDNPPVNPGLLACLEEELVRAEFDVKQLFRLILNSRTYQQSSIPRSRDQDAEALFACYPVRRLEAEVLIDALCRISGTHESYMSPIPEPFTMIPEEHRSIDLADGSITSQFLEMFGRPARDTGLESERDNNPSKAQELHLLNSTHIQEKIEGSRRLRALVKKAKGRRGKDRLVDSIYLEILSRRPTKEEKSTVLDYFQRNDAGLRESAGDLAWALINSKEFLYRH